ncbi:MAG: class I SAM-dependent methyltransferase [Leptospiraceae bacterium]|nr:class I SAM-dependent methyltransferase [Leptospiraceae bacterium]
MKTEVELAPDAAPAFQSGFQRALFDEMSTTYGLVNLLASFGFAWWWRYQSVRALAVQPGQRVLDLMCGMGECFGFIAQKLGHGALHGLDFAPQMIARAQKRALALGRTANPAREVTVRLQDVFQIAYDAGWGNYDRLHCAFGLKTLARDQKRRVPDLLCRLLRPGGRFSFVEIAVPRSAFLRVPYLIYLRYLIPVIGRLLMGNPQNYRMLALYTTDFGAGSDLISHWQADVRLQVRTRPLCGGCACLIYGQVL